MNSRIQAKISRSRKKPGEPALPLGFRQSTLEQELAEIESQKRQINELQQRLQETRAELEEARARQTEIYQASAIGHIDLDQYGTVLEANPVAAQLLGRDPALLRGKPFAIFLRGQDTLRFSEHLRICSRTLQKHTVQLMLQVRD